MNKADVKAVEKDVELLLAEMDGWGDEDIELRSVDLSMPDDYETRVYAIKRCALVREANLTRLGMAACKTANPQQHAQLEKEYAQMVLQVGMVDRRYPAARAHSHELMALAAAEELEDHRKRCDVMRESSGKKRGH